MRASISVHPFHVAPKYLHSLDVTALKSTSLLHKTCIPTHIHLTIHNILFRTRLLLNRSSRQVHPPLSQHPCCTKMHNHTHTHTHSHTHTHTHTHTLTHTHNFRTHILLKTLMGSSSSGSSSHSSQFAPNPCCSNTHNIIQSRTHTLNLLFHSPPLEHIDRIVFIRFILPLLINSLHILIAQSHTHTHTLTIHLIIHSALTSS